MPVRDAMATKVVTCLPSDTLAHAEKAMADAQVRRVPVVDGQGRPIGIVSLNDLARSTMSGGKRLAADVVATLAAVCRPRQRAITRPRAA